MTLSWPNGNRNRFFFFLFFFVWNFRAVNESFTIKLNKMLSCGAEPLILIQELNKFSNEFDVIVLELHSDDGLFRGKSSLNRTTSF